MGKHSRILRHPASNPGMRPDGRGQRKAEGSGEAPGGGGVPCRSGHAGLDRPGPHGPPWLVEAERHAGLRPPPIPVDSGCRGGGGATGTGKPEQWPRGRLGDPDPTPNSNQEIRPPYVALPFRHFRLRRCRALPWWPLVKAAGPGAMARDQRCRKHSVRAVLDRAFGRNGGPQRLTPIFPTGGRPPDASGVAGDTKGISRFPVA